MMTQEEFIKLSGEYNLIPVSARLLADKLTPVSAYSRLRQAAIPSFLLESVEGGERFARYSFIGRNPRVLLRTHAGVSTVTRNGVTKTSELNIFDLIEETISSYRQPATPDLPRFTGGLVGFIGYDGVRAIETLPDNETNEATLDDSMFGLFGSIIAFDHLRHQIIIIVNAPISDGIQPAESYQLAQNEIREIEATLSSPEQASVPFCSSSSRIRHHSTEQEFTSLVAKAKRHIEEGDIFQVVLSQRFSVDFSGDAFNVYRALRVINPSPYLYFLDFSDSVVIGSSPEILVRVENRIAEVYPIAGTRPRGKSEAEDLALERELSADAKERAEHIMLVDLGRNDLGRVCEPGTVEVEKCMFTVRYSHVMHLASKITGKLASGKSCCDALKATFPAGTVSGAPKIRAMEIIGELERTRRCAYAGGVGYFDFSGNMDICIAIRTMFSHGHTMYFQAGAGIVADSDPESEYRESLSKARVLVEALTMAEGITS